MPRYMVWNGSAYVTFRTRYLAIAFAEQNGRIVETVRGKRVVFRPSDNMTSENLECFFKKLSPEVRKRNVLADLDLSRHLLQSSHT